MKSRLILPCICIVSTCGVIWACGFDNSIREYLSLHFWQPFSVRPKQWIKPVKPRISLPFAGMSREAASPALTALRIAYRDRQNDREKTAREALSSVDLSEREEAELIAAKIDMRLAPTDDAELLRAAQKRLRAFLRKAKRPEYRSEARGWIAHIHYLMNELTQAGKIYLDELQRSDTNLSRQTLLNSLSLTYGYSGGQELLEHLDDYFDTPEHAAFAITLATNPRWDREPLKPCEPPKPVVEAGPDYERIKELLLKHKSLFKTEKGADVLTILGMRTALRSGDPKAALEIAANVPADSKMHQDPDFLWILGSAKFLSRDYEGTEAPLLQLHRSTRATPSQQAAAAYGLCGVYQKLRNQVEQIRFALWLHAQKKSDGNYLPNNATVEYQTVYWAPSGWDLGMLLDIESPIELLEAFLNEYPKAANIRLVQYAMAVRLARVDRYQESAAMYAKAGAPGRELRMRQLARLSRRVNEAPTVTTRLQAKYEMAKYLSEMPVRIYFNDRLWDGFQRYALEGSYDARLTRKEREKLIADERRLKDDQEEYWRAYLLLREIVDEAGATLQGRRAARLALVCLRKISPERFGREEQIQSADLELTRLLRRSG